MLAHFGLSFDLLVWPEQLPVAPPRGPAQRMIRPAGRHVYGFMLRRKARTSATSPGGAPVLPRRRRSRLSAIPAHVSFEPRRVGSLEADAWVAYYSREWFTFLRSAVALTRHTF